MAGILRARSDDRAMLHGINHHFETQETLGNPYGFLGRAAMEMMKLTMAA